MWRLFEKQELEINHWNEMLPRTWTEDYIHSLIRRTYNERTSGLAGMFSPTEETGGFVGDIGMVPQFENPTKNIY